MPASTEAPVRAILAASPDPIAAHDGSAILAANAPLARLLGQTVASLEGRLIGDLMPARDRQAMLDRMAGAGQETVAITLERPEGLLEVDLVPREVELDDKRVQLWVFRPHDGQSELERLQEADRLKTRLLNIAAHELNTPLTPLRLQTHLLLSGALGEMTAPQKHAIDVLGRNVKRLSDLVTEILDVARLEAGRLPIDPKPMALEEAVAEAVDSYSETARRVGLTNQVAIDPRLHVHADRQRVLQVLFNLLSNAIKFTPAGGQVAVRARRIAGMAEVDVEDTGAGLTAEQISRLFRPFSQVHDPNQLKVQGTGLGLYICKGIIEAQGGRVTVRSGGPGKGARFRFSLPLAHANPTLVVHEAEPRSPTALARRLRELI
ncbi:MAG: hypothetical protein QOD77_560 [Thermoplasmata archaeon]|nr:hypothetical protein [Thermoplasmata archaeon]